MAIRNRLSPLPIPPSLFPELAPDSDRWLPWFGPSSESSKTTNRFVTRHGADDPSVRQSFAGTLPNDPITELDGK